MAIQWIIAGAVTGAIVGKKLVDLLNENKDIKRSVFFSFKYEDVWKTNTIRNCRTIKGKYLTGFTDKADREEVKRKTDRAIKKWINEQIHGTSVTCVLVGQNTHKSKWVQYEIEQSIEKGNGLLLIHMHEIEDCNGKTCTKGQDPFVKNLGFTKSNSNNMQYPCYNYYDWVSDNGYENFEEWIEEAARQAGR